MNTFSNNCGIRRWLNVEHFGIKEYFPVCQREDMAIPPLPSKTKEGNYKIPTGITPILQKTRIEVCVYYMYQTTHICMYGMSYVSS